MNEIKKVENSAPAVVQDEQTTILSIIQRAASDPTCDIEKMERLLQMHERLQMKQAEAVFSAAMASAQTEMGRVSADSTNRQTHSKYASYAALDRALRPIYTKHGLALSFNTSADCPELSVLVRCTVSHIGGFSRSYEILMPADGKGAKGGDVMTRTHAVGSATSYGMRYLLKMIFNVAIGDDDDDGNGASYQAPAKQPKAANQKTSKSVTESQMKKLHALAKDLDCDHAWLKRFVENLGVSSLKDLRRAQANTIIDALDKLVAGEAVATLHQKLQDAYYAACDPVEAE